MQKNYVETNAKFGVRVVLVRKKSLTPIVNQKTTSTKKLRFKSKIENYFKGSSFFSLR